MAKKRAARGPRAEAPGEDLSARLLLQTTALVAASNGVVITDRQGTILWTNPAFTALTGYTPEEAVGSNLRILKSDRHDAAFYREFWKTILTGKTWHGEFVNRKKDGTIYVNEETVTPVRLHDAEITHFVGIMQDVTQRKEAETQIRGLTEQLEYRVRQRTSELQAANQELEAFAYSVSHDLRAPLRHIKGFLDLFSKTALPGLSEEERFYLTSITNSARQMDRLIDDLLQFSRITQASLQLEPAALNRLLDEALAQVEPETRQRNIRWKRAELPVVQADRSMIGQVFVNLLSNAIKYTRPRNPAEVEIGVQDTDPNEWIVFVRDNGVGFDMRYAGKLFGVFQRLHSSDQFEGTGVGLANVRRIIVRHGGRTWAEAKPEEGATFYFSLPKVKQSLPD
jgi:PAS domain S-box-containing protein